MSNRRVFYSRYHGSEMTIVAVEHAFPIESIRQSLFKVKVIFDLKIGFPSEKFSKL